MHYGRPYLLLGLLAICLVLGMLVNGCRTIDRSRQWAEGEATRRAWATESYVPLMETAIPKP